METVLSIAGSDPTGGAGVQADLQVFGSLGCHGAGVVTAVTVQDTVGVRAVHALPPEWVGEQLACLLGDVAVSAVKTGMLGSAAVVEAVCEALESHPRPPLVVDPVLASTGGHPLLEEAGLKALGTRLLPRAALVTPNLAEAEALTGREVRTPDQMRDAARQLLDFGVGAALVKGGHLPGAPIDVLASGGDVWELAGSRTALERGVHGTGCALASAAAVFLARGLSVSDAVSHARAYVASGLRAARPLGAGQAVLDFRAAAQNQQGLPEGSPCGPCADGS
jgi:hydroxymethylpyrimidine/phosphomethylpyrimidine kinase